MLLVTGGVKQGAQAVSWALGGPLRVIGGLKARGSPSSQLQVALRANDFAPDVGVIADILRVLIRVLVGSAGDNYAPMPSQVCIDRANGDAHTHAAVRCASLAERGLHAGTLIAN